MSRASSIILQPLVWLDGPPSMQNGDFDARALDEEVGRWVAPSGFRTRALRGGRLTFTFEGGKFTPPEPGDVGFNFAALGAAYRERIVRIHAYLIGLYYSIQVDENLIVKKYFTRPSQMMSSDTLDSDGYGWAGADVSLGYLTSASYDHQYREGTPKNSDPRILHRSFNTIKKTTLEEAFKKYLELEQVDIANSFEMLDLYLRAVAHCEEHDYAASLISSWAVIEKLIEIRWQKSLNRRLTESSITQDRKNRIAKDHRTYTAAIRLEILETAGDIEASTYTNTSTLRKSRNDWIHNLRPVTMQDAILGCVIAARWFKVESGVDIELDPALQLGGL